jgi:undecaprenyl-diphosphatase
MSFFQAFIIALIEGLTEFLPVSSTGHMILADSIMQIQNKEFAKTFEIVIQLGAIMAVFFMYIKRFFVGINIYLKLFVAFLPTGVIGFLAYKTIKTYLFNPFTVSISLIIGGVVLILLDKWSTQKKSEYTQVEDISFGGAIKIGLIQCISMIPGVSRAAATIFGGISSGYDLLKEKDNIHSEDITILFFGGAIAFLVAILAIKGFISFLNKYGFKYFGYYRIILGILFLAYATFTGMQMTA